MCGIFYLCEVGIRGLRWLGQGQWPSDFQVAVP